MIKEETNEEDDEEEGSDRVNRLAVNSQAAVNDHAILYASKFFPSSQSQNLEAVASNRQKVIKRKLVVHNQHAEQAQLKTERIQHSMIHPNPTSLNSSVADSSRNDATGFEQPPNGYFYGK